GKSIDILRDILREVSPGISHVAIFREAAAGAASANASETAARHYGLKATIFQARTAVELETAFEGMKDAQVDAVIVLEGLMIFNNAKSIANLASKNRLPAIFFDSAFGVAGGSVNSRPNFTDMHRRAAYFVDRILKGTKPGDLPVERPRTFELVINLKVAKALGLTIPQSVLLRGTEIIQ